MSLPSPPKTPMDRLRVAVQENDTDAVRRVIAEERIRLSAADEDIVMQAVLTAGGTVMGLLTGAGANPFCRCDAPLQTAAIVGNEEMVDWLLGRGADVFAIDDRSLVLDHLFGFPAIAEKVLAEKERERTFFLSGIEACIMRDNATALHAGWYDSRGRETRENMVIRAVKMGCVGEMLSALQALDACLMPQDLFDAADRYGRSLCDVAAEKGCLADLMSAKHWHGRETALLSCWKQMTPAQREASGCAARVSAYHVGQMQNRLRRHASGGIRVTAGASKTHKHPPPVA